MDDQIKIMKTKEGTDFFYRTKTGYMIIKKQNEFVILSSYESSGFESGFAHPSDTRFYNFGSDRFKTYDEAMDEIKDMIRNEVQKEALGRQRLYRPEPVRTPSGMSDSAEVYEDGVIFYGTPSHGFIKLNRKKQNEMPLCLRLKGGWYEEDCEWARVALGFKELFTEREYNQAVRTMKNWNPDAYMEFTGEKLNLEDSYVLRERDFKEKTKDKWVVIAAMLDKDDKSMVNCTATLGGNRGAWNEEVEKRLFKIPSIEYDTRNTFGFIVDEEKHEEIFESEMKPR